MIEQIIMEEGRLDLVEGNRPNDLMFRITVDGMKIHSETIAENIRDTHFLNLHASEADNE